MAGINDFFLRYFRSRQNRFASILWRGDGVRREIALTFDDGPHPRDTLRVLKALAKHNVHATFFLMGRQVEKFSHLVRQIHQNGHQLGIHCYRHFPFPLENPSVLCAHLDRTKQAIAKTCGVQPETIRDVRPPYGFFSTTTLSLLTEWGYRLVLWDNMPLHFIQPVSWTIKQVLERTVPGSIIVLHDGHGHGRRAAEIVNITVPKLKAMNFEFVTIEQMKDQN